MIDVVVPVPRCQSNTMSTRICRCYQETIWRENTLLSNVPRHWLSHKIWCPYHSYCVLYFLYFRGKTGGNKVLRPRPIRVPRDRGRQGGAGKGNAKGKMMMMIGLVVAPTAAGFRQLRALSPCYSLGHALNSLKASAKNLEKTQPMPGTL